MWPFKRKKKPEAKRPAPVAYPTQRFSGAQPDRRALDPFTPYADGVPVVPADPYARDDADRSHHHGSFGGAGSSGSFDGGHPSHHDHSSSCDSASYDSSSSYDSGSSFDSGGSCDSGSGGGSD